MKKVEAFWATYLKQFNVLDNRLIVSVIVFSFAFLFLFLFKPFGMDYWISDTFGKRSFILLFICLYAFAIILISQFIQNILFRKKEYKIYHFIYSLMAEIVSISVPLAYLSTSEHSSFINEMIVTSRLIAVTLILCYFVALLIWFAFQKEKSVGYISVTETEVDMFKPAEDNLFLISDESGNIRFEIESRCILYFASEDNYVMIHYVKDDKYQKKLIRATLKSIEEEALSHGCIRCHRSFIVNHKMIQKVKRIGRNYHILLAYAEESIPVSKSYEAHVTSLFEIKS